MQPISEASKETVDAADEDEVQPATNEKDDMDALLLRSFLQAAKTSLKQETKEGLLKVGPLAIDVFYAQHVRPARPVGTSLDVHKSSYKKVSKFVDYLKNADLLTCDAKGLVTRISHSHPDVRNFTLHEVEVAGGSDAAACGKKGSEREVVYPYPLKHACDLRNY